MTTKNLLKTIALSLIVCSGQPLLAQPANTLELTACELPGISVPTRCGTYSVYENRTTRKGRKIPLRVVVIPATGDHAEPDPIVFFAGGPGASTVEMATELVAFRGDDLKYRDFLLVDYRGTGESYPLFCPYQKVGTKSVEDALNHFINLQDLPECYQALSKNADLTQYTTANIVDDVAEVATALGYQQVNLWGGSYGTRAALSYLRRHEHTVRTVVLEGVAPQNARVPVTFAQDAQTAMTGWIRECQNDTECQQTFPDFETELAQILQAIQQQSQTLTVNDPNTQEEITFTLNYNAVIQTLRYMLYTPNSALRLPAFVHAAAQGQWQPIGQAAFFIGQSLLSAIPDGLYLSVTCTEDVAFIGPNAKALQTGFMGDFRLHQQQAACTHWVRGEIPDNFFEPIVSNKPVLIISGEHDPVTPARFGYQVQEYLPQSRHLVVPHSGHAPYGLKNIECINQLQSQLLTTAAVENLKTQSCAMQIECPPFLLQAQAEEPISLSQKALQRFVGDYQNEDASFSINLSLGETSIIANLGGQSQHLVPVRPLRFIIKGSPPGDHFDFQEDERGHITTMVLVNGGQEQITLHRQ